MKKSEQRVIKHYGLAIKTIKKLPNKKYKLIDVGAAGRLLKKYLPKNIDYYSLDYFGKHDYVFDLNKGKVPIKSESFDIVVCLETLEHVLEPYKAMKEILRIGKKDAVFILSMPNEYNFVLRLYYLFGKKTSCQEPFKIVSKGQHIHQPRVKDVISFFSKFIKIEEKEYYWQSRKSVNNDFFYSIDYFINLLAKIYPSLFARVVAVKGIKKLNDNFGK